jgi:hypothetical protein
VAARPSDVVAGSSDVDASPSDVDAGSSDVDVAVVPGQGVAESAVVAPGGQDVGAGVPGGAVEGPAEAGSGGRWPEPGPVAEEAARLLEVAGDWARRAVPQVVAVLRGERPEVTEKVLEAGAAVAAAARAVLDALASRADPDDMPDPDDEPDDPPERRVEPIDVE